MLQSIRCFEKDIVAIFKEMSIFLQTKGNNQKEIEHFIQSLQVLENPIIDKALFELCFQQYKELID